MASSQNGYPVLFSNRTSGDLPRLRKWVIPRTNRHLYLRDGSTGFLLAVNALWFHERIERLDNTTWDEWGWAVRPVRGQTSGYSNHSSGTAEDLNATKHPRGVSTRSTFTAAQVERVHERLDGRMERTLRWGGDYHSTPDGMHFEIDRSLSDCERVARKLIERPLGERVLAANPGAKAVILS